VPVHDKTCCAWQTIVRRLLGRREGAQEVARVPMLTFSWALGPLVMYTNQSAIMAASSAVL
jgi:hypothetical protein